MRAKRAVVSLNQNAPIKLIDVSGEMTETNKAITKLKAKHGLFDNAKGELELFDGIEIDSTNGMVARLSRATMYPEGEPGGLQGPGHRHHADGIGAGLGHDDEHQGAPGGSFAAPWPCACCRPTKGRSGSGGMRASRSTSTRRSSTSTTRRRRRTSGARWSPCRARRR